MSYRISEYFRLATKDGRLTRRRVLSGAAVVGLGLFTAACSSTGFSRLGSQQTAPTINTGQPVATGDLLGTGSVKVALLVPRSANGNAGALGTALRNAAQLAVSDFSGADIQILVKDTQGTPSGAAAAAQEAVSQGAELIIGPLIGASVAAAAPVARSANVPIIAFSTDASVAGSGVYLLSFLPQNDIKRIVSYATSQGRRSFAAHLPDNAYGTIAEGAFRQAASRTGARVAAIERYPLDSNQLILPTERLGKTAASSADAILMPDGSAAISAITPILSSQGVNPQSIKLLGSGQWDSPTLRQNQFLQGGWYPAPDPSGWNRFRGRYQSSFGAAPPRLATLSYDAVSLAAALTRAPASNRYAPQVLTNPSGFSGIDGVFRFLRDGTNERGLAVLEVTSGGGMKIIDPAPGRFGTGS